MSLSKIEFRDEVRRRTLQRGKVLAPAVREVIQNLKRRKITSLDDDDLRTIVHMDIQMAILTGTVPEDPIDQEDQWCGTFNGSDTEGEELTVQVECPKDSTEPVLIVGACLPQP